jgi:hypothetical protein
MSGLDQLADLKEKRRRCEWVALGDVPPRLIR